jgi:hypothetical protein
MILAVVRLAKLSTLTFEDPTWDDATALIYSTIEPNGGVLAACLPVMAPLFNKFFPRYSLKSRKPQSDQKPGIRHIQSYKISRRPSESVPEDEHELVDYGNPSAARIRQTTEISIHRSTSDNHYRDKMVRYYTPA